MGRREWEVWTRCDRCLDLTNVVFWIRENHQAGGYKAILENSTSVCLQTIEGEQVLVHRPGHCNGSLKLLDPMPDKTILEM